MFRYKCKVIALSTDKAVSPLNLYGATKLCSDKLFISANNIVGKRKLSFSVVRYGNVMGSRGSVIPQFLKQKETGIINVTDKRMTRFNILMEDSIKLVLWALKNSIGGEVFVPKIPSYRILDLARAVAPNCKINYVGLRPGEKLHEELISIGESYNTIDLKKYYAILNFDKSLEKKYLRNKKIKKVKNEFSYSSGKNDKFLTTNELIKLIKKSKFFNKMKIIIGTANFGNKYGLSYKENISSRKELKNLFKTSIKNKINLLDTSINYNHKKGIYDLNIFRKFNLISKISFTEKEKKIKK